MKASPFTLAKISGVLLLIVAVVLLVVSPTPQDNLPDGFYTPVIAFEFIQTKAEIMHFFEVKDVPAYEASMLTGNVIDYGFMVLYSLLLFFIALGIYRITSAKTMYLAMFLCVVMLAGDAIENFYIYKLVTTRNIGNNDTLQSFPHYSFYLQMLNIFTWLKWSSIASTFLLFAPFFFKGKIFHKVIALLSVVCFGLCIAAYLQHGILNEIFASSVVLVFLLLAIFVFTFREKDKTAIA